MRSAVCLASKPNPIASAARERIMIGKEREGGKGERQRARKFRQHSVESRRRRVCSPLFAIFLPLPLPLCKM